MNFRLSKRLPAFITLLILLLNQPVSAQNDTTWYDTDGYPTTQEEAFSYSLKPIETDSGYQIKEFYLSDEKKMEGYSSSSDGNKLDGWAFWYDQNGDISTRIFYEQGVRKKYISFWEGKEFASAEYRNNQPFAGTILVYAQSRRAYLMPTYVEGFMQSLQIFESDPKGIRYGYTLTVDNDGDTLRQYEFYNEQGKLLGEYECVDLEFEMYGDEEDKAKKNGTFVDYYTNPMQVGAIIQYRKGKVLNRKDYYRTGDLREEIVVDGDTATAKYYKPNGMLLGKFTAPYSNKYGHFRRGGTGTRIYFYAENQSKSSPVKKIVRKKDGEDVEMKTFTTSGNLVQLIQYGNDGDRTEQHFSKEGKIVHEMIWRNHAPYHGTHIVSDLKHEIYHEGEVVEKIFFYKTGERFSYKKGDTETYYSRDGKVIAKATFESFESDRPIEGIKMQLLNSKLRYEKHYEDGEEIKRIEFFHFKKPLRISKKETFYKKGSRKSREKSYYSTGDLRSDIMYDGYREKSATYYNKSGEIVGKLEYIDGKKIGIEVDFYYESDLVETVITYNTDGEMLSEKKYNKSYDEDHMPYTSLEAEIQANGTSKYYDYSGNLMAEAIFSEGLPVSGVTVEHPSYNNDYETYIERPYKDGELHGIVRRYRYYDNEADDQRIGRETAYQNGQRHGADKRYYHNGKLNMVRHYQEGQLHGKNTHYNKEGEVELQNTYNNGKPFDGIFESTVPYDNSTEYKFDEGSLIYCTFRKEEQLVEKTTFDNGDYKTLIYDKKGNVSTTIVLDADKNGTIIHHAYKEGRSKGIIKDGDPLSGTFYFTFFQKYEMEDFGEVDLLEVTFQTTSWKLIAYDPNGVELFQLTEQKKWEDSDVISRYIWVGSYLTDLSLFYKYQWSTFN